MYIDGFLVPLAKKHVKAYRAISSMAAKVWIEYGALEYHECAGDDLAVKGVVPFPRAARAKPGETVVFAWIVYKSKAHRDRVNKKVMADPRMNVDPSTMPFDSSRMAYGGFKAFVSKRAQTRR